MEIKEVKEEISSILKSELAGTDFSAFFFGSRVAGTNTETSDIDVGIEGASPVPDSVFRTIRSRIESLPTLYTIDVVDFATVSEDFKRVAKTHLERIL